MISAKGLSNTRGSNNCFLNVIIFALWNFRYFRQQILQSGNHSHTVKPTLCIYCELIHIFRQFIDTAVKSQSAASRGKHNNNNNNNNNNNRNNVVNADAIRFVVSELFKGENKFQSGQTSDAGEMFVDILRVLHLSSTTGVHILDSNGIASPPAATKAMPQQHRDSSECLPPCLIHRTFSFSTIDEIGKCPACKDNVFTKPATPREFSVCVVSSSVLSTNLQNVLRAQMRLASPLTVPCHLCATQAVRTSRTILLHCPDVFTVSFMPEKETITKAECEKLLHNIPANMDLQQVFPDIEEEEQPPQSSGSRDGDKDRKYLLRGIVLYYGAHFYAYFLHSRLNKFFRFDDETISNESLDLRSLTHTHTHFPLGLFLSPLMCDVMLTNAAHMAHAAR